MRRIKKIICFVQREHIHYTIYTRLGKEIEPIQPKDNSIHNTFTSFKT
jgi:hypothetical protein